MTAIPHAAGALTSALGRFERASQRLLEAATGASDVDIVTPLVEISEARHQAQAGLAMLRFSDAMMQTLLELQSEPPKE